MSPLSSDDKTSNDKDSTSVLLERIAGEFGDALVGSHVAYGDLWVRVSREVWAHLANWLKSEAGFGFFNFLSAVDWMTSPFGRDMDSLVDNTLSSVNDTSKDTAKTVKTANKDIDKSSKHGPLESKRQSKIESGVTGGDTRFQMLARVNDVQSHLSVFAKTDLANDDLRVDSWVPAYPGADWHEREAWEMFGITFNGHPGLRHLYLPGEFEGHPMRKDYPLLARRIKPWPGIVDVEPIPDLISKNGPSQNNLQQIETQVNVDAQK